MTRMIKIKRIRYGLLLLAIVFIAWGTIAVQNILLSKDIKQASKTFITALITGDIEKAKAMASGQVLFNLNREHTLQVSNLVNLHVTVSNMSKEWGTVTAVVESESPSAEINVQWYTISLHKLDNTNQWKVYSIKTIPPVLRGLKSQVTEQDESGTISVLEGYMQALAATKYDAAADYLVGPAKNAHVASGKILYQTPIAETFEIVEFKPILKQGSFLLAKAKHLADHREVKVSILFYKTSKGWRIAEITPL